MAQNRGSMVLNIKGKFWDTKRNKDKEEHCMRKLASWIILLCLVLGLSCVGLATSIDQFIAPVDGGPTVVVNVVVEGEDGVIEAEMAQDGFNYASQTMRPLKGGFREVRFGSGFGYVAGAAEYYEVFDNPNATLVYRSAADDCRYHRSINGSDCSP